MQEKRDQENHDQENHDQENNDKMYYIFLFDKYNTYK